ncbi:MAG: glycine/sarcosine/betaine reductase selenoprotein B family protein [Myxococcales bacterium]
MFVDSYKFLDFASRRVMKAWAEREPERPPVWTPLRKPLRECRVALVSSAGIARRDQPAFDQEGERRNPWWGDPSLRVLPLGTTERDVRLYHLHIDVRHGEQDLDCVLPLRRLEEAAQAGLVGSVAPSHYSFMGYLLDLRQFLADSVPRMIARMKSEEVDAALLVPA